MTIERRSPFWRALFLALSALALGALVLAAACGGDDDDDDDDGGDSSPTATRTSDGTDSDDNGGDDDDDGGDDDDESSVLDDLENFAGEYEGADGVVTYTFTSEGADSGSWTIYTEGDKSRVDYGDESGAFISITTPGASYTCSVSDGEGFCFEGDGGIGANPFAGLFTSFASSEAIFGYLQAFTDVEADTSSEDIAGTDANCYTLSGDFTGDTGSIKWCFAENGLLLLAQYDLDSGKFEMRATDFSDSVPGGIFDPPYELTSLGQ